MNRQNSNGTQKKGLLLFFCAALVGSTQGNSSSSSVESSIYSQALANARFEFVSQNFIFNTSHVEIQFSELSTVVSASIKIPDEKDEEEIRQHLMNYGFRGDKLDEMARLYLKADNAVINYLKTIEKMDATANEKIEYAAAADDIRLKQFEIDMRAAREIGKPYGREGDLFWIADELVKDFEDFLDEVTY